MILSILICTIDSRRKQYNELLSKLTVQSHRSSIEIDINSYCDNKEISIGSKRQSMLLFSRGDYIVFIDDDDAVSDNYIDVITNEIILNHPDSIGFKIECDMEGKKELAIASNKYSDWCENKDGFRYCRTPYHKTPIKREIALQIGYKDMRFGEDYDYSKRLKESELIKTESFIDEVMYYYNYKYEDPKTKYGIAD